MNGRIETSNGIYRCTRHGPNYLNFDNGEPPFCEGCAAPDYVDCWLHQLVMFADLCREERAEGSRDAANRPRDA